MAKLFVIPGHGAGDPGACGNGYAEADQVRKLALKIKELGGDEIELADFSRNYYADNGISYLELPAGCAIVELHMDSGANGARGAHVITYPEGTTDRHRSLASKVSALLPGRANIMVERDDLANPWRACNRGFEYCLVENGFISNLGDASYVEYHMEELARCYLEAYGIEEEDKMAMAPVWVPDEGSAVWRFYNRADGTHMFTASKVERDTLEGSGWQFEGVAWENPEPRLAIYRLYNPHNWQHMFTIDFEEASVLQKAGWAYEGVQLFSADSSGSPVYRAYNPNTSDHMFTTSKEEQDSLIAAGWRDEGVAWYV